MVTWHGEPGGRWPLPASTHAGDAPGHGQRVRLMANAQLVVWLGVAVVFDLALKILQPDALPLSPAAHLFAYPIVAATGALLVASVLVSPDAPLARALSARWLRVLGKYSYAMYLWQIPLDHLLRTIGLGATETGELPYFLIATAATLLAAVASWRLVESKPLGHAVAALPVTARRMAA